MKVIASKLVNSTLSGSDYFLVKETIAGYDFLNNYETIQKYKDKIETKLPQVTDINYTLENGLNFHVLPNGSAKHLTIGKDTDCCQRLGGAGEDAAIDSFINSDENVLLLSGPNGLIAQSYFHYVPKDNGYILDNIEINKRKAKGIDLESVYYSLAKKLKEDKKAAYVKCGERSNKISNDYFNKAKLEEDPRKFSVEDPYSDFNEDEHLDLESPTVELPLIGMTKSASINIFKKTALDLLVLDHQITKLAKVTNNVISNEFHKLAINFSNILSDKLINKINHDLAYCKGLDSVDDVLSKFELKILKGKNYLAYQGTNKRPLGFMDMQGISVRNAELNIINDQNGVKARITKTPLREWGLLEEKVLGPFTKEVD